MAKLDILRKVAGRSRARKKWHEKHSQQTKAVSIYTGIVPAIVLTSTYVAKSGSDL